MSSQSPDPTLPVSPATANAPQDQSQPYVQMMLPGMVVGQHVTQWQSPYPPPEAAERFEALHPGAFARILTIAEQAQTAQVEANRMALEFAQRDTRRGQWLGWNVSMTAVLAAVLVGLMGQPWLAAVFLSVPVLGVTKALVDSGRAPPATPTPLLPPPSVNPT